MTERRRASTARAGGRSAPRYPTAGQLAATDKLARMDLVVPQLRDGKGQPWTITVRALSFVERQECNRAAVKAGRALGLDWDSDTWSIERAWRALDRPRLDRSQLQTLLDLPADVIDEIVQTSVYLGKFAPGSITAELERLAGLQIPAPAAAAGPGGAGERGGAVADADRPADGADDR